MIILLKNHIFCHLHSQSNIKNSILKGRIYYVIANIVLDNKEISINYYQDASCKNFSAE